MTCKSSSLTKAVGKATKNCWMIFINKLINVFLDDIDLIEKISNTVIRSVLSPAGSVSLILCPEIHLNEFRRQEKEEVR